MFNILKVLCYAIDSCKKNHSNYLICLLENTKIKVAHDGCTTLIEKANIISNRKTTTKAHSLTRSLEGREQNTEYHWAMKIKIPLFHTIHSANKSSIAD